MAIKAAKSEEQRAEEEEAARMIQVSSPTLNSSHALTSEMLIHCVKDRILGTIANSHPFHLA